MGPQAGGDSSEDPGMGAQAGAQGSPNPPRALLVPRGHSHKLRWLFPPLSAAPCAAPNHHEGGRGG